MAWPKSVLDGFRQYISSWEHVGMNTYTKDGWKITRGSDDLWYVHPPKSPGYTRGQAFGAAQRMMADWCKSDRK